VRHARHRPHLLRFTQTRWQRLRICTRVESPRDSRPGKADCAGEALAGPAKAKARPAATVKPLKIASCFLKVFSPIARCCACCESARHICSSESQGQHCRPCHRQSFHRHHCPHSMLFRSQPPTA